MKVFCASCETFNDVLEEVTHKATLEGPEEISDVCEGCGAIEDFDTSIKPCVSCDSELVVEDTTQCQDCTDWEAVA